jgi:ATP-dependent RNA helicase DHX57
VEIGFVPIDSIPTSPELNKHSENVNLLKAVIAGGLWPRVARVRLPTSAVKFDKIQAGAIQRENAASEFKFFDIGTGRAFLHPASILFDNAVWKSPFVAYFQKHLTTKVFLRDATEVNDVPSFTPKLTRITRYHFMLFYYLAARWLLTTSQGVLLLAAKKIPLN